ncbi:MAG: NADH/NAD ratio-sensing transcriptional regulator Rex [Thermodesulfobacterium sp.]|uniref:Redox-sensing transcriptional repressor Rex n=1 Tax=Candidatus Thermodesulfobacterium syntrophicum TaxID=3060442 RepID=A0AAE3P4C4_9BACT|nr:NADH/NAD ratio-sensing transcriptional regulator Rex [Candidatus Thermodesulfobacterium syntrophicum]
MKIKNTPENTLERLIIYLKVLEALEKKNVNFISSEDLAKSCGVNSAQLRKDLSFVGSLGTKGVGYSIKSLKYSLKNFLGRAQEWNLILGGISPLGIFLLQDKTLQKEGFYFLAAFDTKEENVGKMYNGISVYNLDQLSYVVNAIKVDIGVIATEEEPEIFLNAFVEQGVKAILNLSKVPLFVENPEIKIENFSFSMALTKLSYFLKE